MTQTSWVFFLDIDNTLIDNDQVKADLDRHLRAVVGSELTDQVWHVYEAVRIDTGVVDFDVVFERLLAAGKAAAQVDSIRQTILAIPYAQYVYPGVTKVLERLGQLGTTVILSDGDRVYQARKIRESGIGDLVEGRVFLTVHKEQELEDACHVYPAGRYAIIDDKPHILGVIESIQPERWYTILVKQGKYAHDPKQLGGPPPDLQVDRIDELMWLRLSADGMHFELGKE